METLSKKRLLICLSIATLFWSIIPVFSALFTSNTYAFNNVGWFLILYLFAGYIRFHVQANSNWKFNLKLALLSGSVVAAFAVIMVFIGHKISNPALDQFSALLAEINSPFTLILGIELFLTFLKMEPFSNRFINIIASTTFGVYLIHDHPLVREFLWKKLLKLPESIYYSKWLWIHMIVTVLMVFIFSSGIDFLRQATFEKMYMKAVDKGENAVQLISKKLLDFSYCFWEKILS